ncbi:MAG: tripartite tricarboxylate transporter substrate binding protein [Xanthobacteraceae bacterium]
MKLPRRTFLHLAAAAAALPAMPRVASTLDYPSRPVRIIVGFAPGGTSDISARLVGQWLSERLGRQFITENKTGAAGIIAAEYVVKAAPDGYTLLAFASAAAINATLYTNLNFNFIRDIAPVASILRVPNVILVNPSFPAATVPEFIAYAKANPGKINMATAGIGSTPHIFGELFKMMTGVNLLTVHYRGGGPALTDLLGGQVQVMFDPVGEAVGYIKAGRLRALAVTSATRLPALPDIPTVGDFVPGYEAEGWSGMGAPRNTPVEIIDTLNKEINAGLADPKMKARLVDLGSTPLAQSPGDFGKLFADEIKKWAKVIQFANIKAE